MFAYIFVLSFCLIASNAQANNPSLTDESCYTTGLWTIWFSVNGSQSTSNGNDNIIYTTLVRLANESCQSPLAAQFGVNEFKSANENTPGTFSAWTELLVVLARMANLLDGRDFSVRYCCKADSSNNKTTTTTTTSVTSSKTTTTRARTTTIASNVSLTSLDGSVCGKQAITPKSRLTSRIFGGSDATAHSWPWMVIFYQIVKCATTTSSSSLCYSICGGTIINRNYVLTAAHCINTTVDSDMVIIAGMHKQSLTTETNTRQVRSVSRVHIHPQYEMTYYSNDIALLRVNTSFTYTDYVQPACLPVTDPADDDEVIIVGWGTNRLGGQVSDTLKQAYSNVIGNCKPYWAQVQNSLQICIANTDSGDSACHGDSGGPLLSLNNGQYVVAGVASYGYTCNTAGVNSLPNVYTRVSSYKAWIKSIAT